MKDKLSFFLLFVIPLMLFSCPVADNGAVIMPPTGLSVIAGQDAGTVSLSWIATGSASFGSPNTGSSFSYHIYVSTSGSAVGFNLEQTVQGASVPENSCALSGLLPGHTYYFKVNCEINGNVSAFSEAMSATLN